ncbi:MAG: response regulator transcription factor [Candidatus Lutibacillus vidarii]|jgi:DNA-binding NarL/FixJ family response regulator|nr:response regulator transcription factor [Candidatus Lutibacillus vidarii]
MTIRVVLVDDHQLVRAGLRALLDLADDVEVVGEAGNGADALPVVASLTPDVVLMDLSMPVMDGIEATRRIREQTPDAHVVVLTSFTEEDRFAAALAAGAIGYLIKDSDPEDVIDAVRAAAVGHAPIDPRMARALLPGGSTDPRLGAPAAAAPAVAEGRIDGLSLREREVLSLVAGGLANKQIARALGISDRTVKTHLANIFRNIGVADRTSAAMWARDHGIV